MPDVYYDSTLTGQELDEALKKIPLIDKAVEDAQKSAKASESWAQGGTDTREGEDEDNAEYWAGQAKSSAATASAGAQVVTDNRVALDAVKDNIEAIQSAPDNALRAEAAAEDASASAEAAEAAAKNAQSIAQGQKGYYATEAALRTAVPDGQDGDWAIVGETDTVWVWDSDASEWSNSGNKTDLSLYYTKSETDTKLGSYYTKKEVDDALAAKQNDLAEEHLEVTLTNSAVYPANDSQKTVDLKTKRANTNYTVDARITGVTLPDAESTVLDKGDTVGAAGHIVISDKATNGFKVAYTGAARGATVELTVRGGM